MSNMNGLEVQSRLREVSPDTKVIVMTGRETARIRAAALEGGACLSLEAVRRRGVSFPHPSRTPLRDGK
jgi:DNA-binding NtrC family response regulator